MVYTFKSGTALMSGYRSDTAISLTPGAGRSDRSAEGAGHPAWLAAAIVESSADAILALDLQGTILSWNTGAAKLFGYRAEEAIGQSRNLVIPPEQMSELELTEVSYRLDTFRLTKDGRRIATSSTVSPLKDRDGRIIGSLEIAREASVGNSFPLANEEDTGGERIGRSEQLHRMAFAVAPIGIASIAPDGCFLEVNQSLCDITGYSAAELRRINVAELALPEDDRPGEAALLQLLLSGAASIYGSELRLLRKDGQVRWVSVRATPLGSFPAGTEFGLGLFLDLSERKRAEARLVEQDGLLSALVEQAPMGMHAVDDQFRMRRINEVALSVFKSDQPVIGRDFQEILESQWGPELGTEITAIFRRTLETGERYVAPTFTEHRADLGAEKTYEWELQRLTLPNGKFALGCYFSDVTHMAQLGRTVIENERRFQEMIEAIPAAVYTTDSEGYLTHFNPAAVALAGRTPELGTDRWSICWKLSLPDGTPLEPQNSFMAIALREGRIVRGVEFVVERPDGTNAIVMPFPTPIRDSTGRIVGGINMLVDITDRKRIEAALRESQAHVQLATEASGMGIWEWNIAAGTIRWDRVMFQIYGIEPTADLTIPLSAWSNAVLDEDLAEQERGLRETIRRRLPGTREFRIRRPGEDGWRYIRSMDTVRTNSRGEVEWVLGTNVDVTEQKRAGQALQAIETRLRLGMWWDFPWRKWITSPKPSK